ncbi:BlaI/MecI/CopY family transcriptional regulator [Paenibacillus kribbensis]|uniref:BlaI/MecI/CopY family transcriptional regulator n=1 Tax=Paenibacillus kribbensis TaxID=172713 RepID=UPI0015B92705|nr:BlaI/MecI/CopY family transcriptional regulator [Paenibacillus kribbensis]
MSKAKSTLSLTEREMDVMRIFWKSKKPLVASDITKIDESLSSNTVQAVIRRLLEKGCIKVADIVYSGTVLTRSYTPVVSKKELIVQQFVSQFRNEEDNVPIPNLVAILLKYEKNEKEVIDQLEKLLEERKKLLTVTEIKDSKVKE